MSVNADSIPSIDFGPIDINLQDVDINDKAFREVGEELVKAFTDIGFCVVKKHGIDAKLLDKSLDVSKCFFNQSLDVKKRFLRNPEGLDYTGWLPLPNTTDIDVEPEYFETDAPDYKELYNVGKFCKEFPSDNDVPGFRSTALSLIDKMDLVAKRLVIALGFGLNLEDPRSLSKTTEAVELKPAFNCSQARLAYYPRVSPDLLREGQMRCGEHTDIALVALLFCNGVSGLEIASRQGKYFKVPHCDDGLIINIGDYMERLTGGALHSAPHRVTITEDNKREDRYSIIYFLMPDYNQYMDPQCGAKDKYKERMTAMDILRLRVGEDKKHVTKGLCEAFDTAI